MWGRRKRNEDPKQIMVGVVGSSCLQSQNPRGGCKILSSRPAGAIE